MSEFVSELMESLISESAC